MPNGLLEGTVIGNVVREPEQKSWNNQTFLTFPVAVNTFSKGKEETTYVDCTLWGKQIESFLKNARKGALVFLSGGLRLNEYEYKGEKRTKLQMNVNTCRILFGGGGGGQRQYQQQVPKQEQSYSQQDQEPSSEEIPF